MRLSLILLTHSQSFFSLSVLFSQGFKLVLRHSTITAPSKWSTRCLVFQMFAPLVVDTAFRCWVLHQVIFLAFFNFRDLLDLGSFSLVCRGCRGGCLHLLVHEYQYTQGAQWICHKADGKQDNRQLVHKEHTTLEIVYRRFRQWRFRLPLELTCLWWYSDLLLWALHIVFEQLCCLGSVELIGQR